MEIGAYAGLAAFFGLVVLALLTFTQARDLRRLREWAGSAPERDAERKEATSAAAAQRAEEMRRLEDARSPDREAADLRETRRERREAGLPEQSRTERFRAIVGGSSDRGRSRFAQPGFMVAIFLAVVLIGGGVAYAVTQSGDSGSTGKSGSKKRSGQKGAAASPAETEVAVLNGTAVPDLAASFGDEVEARGYKLGVITNTNSAADSSYVMFMPNHGAEAHKVADLLEISQVRAMTQDVASVSEGAPVVVVIGEDNASSEG
jgi:hypothetical protein